MQAAWLSSVFAKKLAICNTLLHLQKYISISKMNIVSLQCTVLYKGYKLTSAHTHQTRYGYV